MNRSIASLAICFLVIAAGCGSTPTPSAPHAAKTTARPLPVTDVEALRGGAARPIGEITRGRVAVIDLWASWCTACKDVSKHLELLADAKRGTDLLIVGLDVGEDRSTVASFLEGKQLRYEIYLDPKFGFADALGQKELPAVVVVDRKGVVRLVRRKVDAEVVKLVDDLLAVPPTNVATAR